MLKKVSALLLSQIMLLSAMFGSVAFARDFVSENVALASRGSIATTSSTMPPDSNPKSFKEDNAIDGVRNTGLFWNDATANSYPDIFQVSFVKREVIDTINVFTVSDDVGATMPTLDTTFKNYGIKDFRVQYFDGKVWQTIPNGSVVNNNHVWVQFKFEPITTRAIRLVITNASGYSRLSEIEAWSCAPSPDPDFISENVALPGNGGLPEASSSHPAGFSPYNAVNGVRSSGTFWNDNTPNAYPDWYQVTFKGRQLINKINLFSITDDVGQTIPTLDTITTKYGLRAFQVQYLAQDSTWKTVPGGTITNNNKVWNEFTFDPILTSAIRIYITATIDGYSRICELEAWSCAPSPDIEEELPEDPDSTFGNAKWIWQTQAGPNNQWMCFRKSFALDNAPESAKLNIAVDSKYYMWINGEMVVFEGGLNRGPAPGKGYYDEVDIASYLKEGNNTIAVLVWFWDNQGRNNVNSGAGGMLLSAIIDDIRINSDKTWKMIPHPAYLSSTSGEQPSYLYGGYNIGFDARLDFASDWTQPSFNDSAWIAASQKGNAGSAPWGELEKRPIPLWKYSELLNYTNDIVREGTKITMNLPYGAQTTPYLKINAPAALAGQKIDIRTDRYATPGGPGDDRNLYRGHRVEYIIKEGVQEFEALDWAFGEQVIYTIPEGVEILELKYRESACDTELVPVIQTSDPFYIRLAEKAQRTLIACMRDNFMDCPDRERGQWIGDVSSQAPQVFYALDQNGAQFLKKAIDNFIRNRAGNILIGNVPGAHSSELPSQSLNAISTEGMIMQYYQFTGDTSVIDLAYEPVRNYLKLWSFNADGSLINRGGNWEWYDHGANIDGAILGPTWYYLACKAAIQMAEMTGNEQDIPWFIQKMAGIENTFESKFWKGNGYRSGTILDDRANAMAVLSGLAKPEHYPIIKNVLETVKYSTPYMEGYVLESLFVMGYPEAAMARMKDRYASLVANENSTLWEDFFVLGTKNHAWSGGPLTLLNKYVAGIYPTTPGYDTYRVTPIMGDLTSVNVTIPSIKGDIGFNLEYVDSKYVMNLSSPENTVARVAVPRINSDNAYITANGTAIFAGDTPSSANGITFVDADAKYVYFDVLPGEYEFVSSVQEEAYPDLEIVDLTYESNTLKVTVAPYNKTDEAIEVVLFTALYDNAQNKLVAIQKNDLTLEAKKRSDINLIFENIEQSLQGYKLKVFMWEKGSLKPLTNSIQEIIS